MASNKPKITDLPIQHMLFQKATSVFGHMCVNACDGIVLAMVGPPQAGKSIIFNHIVDEVSRTYAREDGSIPVISVQMQSVEEGRVKGKWLSLMLLKELKHPVYMHIGELDELDHYLPSRSRDEGSLRAATDAALRGRGTKRVAVDEAHLLTRTKRSELRGHILESLKSMAAINRTLLLCGGYELAYQGLFDHPHFAGRTVVYDIGRYTDSLMHREEWKRILDHFAKYLDLEPRCLLLDFVDVILLVTNGVIGLAEKWLWMCKQYAEATHKPITIDVLRSFAPSLNEQRIIAEDIRRGTQALKNLPDMAKTTPVSTPTSPSDGASSSKAESKPRSTRRPFERAPRRIKMSGFEIYQDD